MSIKSKVARIDRLMRSSYQGWTDSLSSEEYKLFIDQLLSWRREEGLAPPLPDGYSSILDMDPEETIAYVRKAKSYFTDLEQSPELVEAAWRIEAKAWSYMTERRPSSRTRARS